MPLRTLLLGAAVLAAAPDAALAQDAVATGPATLCFRGRPVEHYGAFLLTEMSLGTRDRGDDNGLDLHPRWEVGAMVNVGEGSAVGGTLADDEPHDGRWGASLRYRRWLEGGMAVDLSPGFVVGGDDHDGRNLRLTANVSISAGDWIGGFVQGESGRDGGQLSAGFKLGSWLGAIAGGALYGLLSALPAT